MTWSTVLCGLNGPAAFLRLEERFHLCILFTVRLFAHSPEASFETNSRRRSEIVLQGRARATVFFRTGGIWRSLGPMSQLGVA